MVSLIYSSIYNSIYCI